ncbi:WRKY transcription factor 75 [Tripterygium wilfordii]|uniref:WRKY transcription factor 75 n=1 Tax=Tripterygium wilfordii TaxID=458696 RepID=A0A7J7D4J3_TRIWF|nr:probable WRKY transcription factor 75 [Tripterygium wilfordii]KAF5741179.1 WRKY transcription factor 75 [Tripterygium wilfordii]
MDNYTGLIFPSSSSSPPSSSSTCSLSINMSSSSTISHGLVSEMEVLNNNLNIGSPDPIRSSLGGSEMEDEVMKRSEGSDMKKKGAVKKVKKPRYAFQTRSQVDILDDGYRWRKYGQKAVKNNKFPRSYYRCTHQGCNVKKQVQRLTKDEGVVVTTYEGMHSHPIEKSSHDNFEHILAQMQIYTPSF